MKTPRHILLARHRGMETKLDHTRQRVIAGLSAAPNPHAGHRLLAAWREFFHVPRAAWAGLAAVWLVILGLNFAARETAAPALAAPRAEAPRSPETLQALREQKRLFAELVGPLQERDASLPRFVPRPRSERPSLQGVA